MFVNLPEQVAHVHMVKINAGDFPDFLHGAGLDRKA
jgi:hypothetical protein